MGEERVKRGKNEIQIAIGRKSERAFSVEEPGTRY
jgi:hypothetical protein